MTTWYNVYLTVVNRQAPLKRKRVKHPKLPPWLNKDIKETMAEREKKFPEYKKLRNKVKKYCEKPPPKTTTTTTTNKQQQQQQQKHKNNNNNFQ